MIIYNLAGIPQLSLINFLGSHNWEQKKAFLYMYVNVFHQMKDTHWMQDLYYVKLMWNTSAR